jgi:hypothetical protein
VSQFITRSAVSVEEEDLDSVANFRKPKEALLEPRSNSGRDQRHRQSVPCVSTSIKELCAQPLHKGASLNQKNQFLHTNRRKLAAVEINVDPWKLGKAQLFTAEWVVTL